MSTPRRRRSIAVVATGTAVFASAALFVHHEDNTRRDYQGVCVDDASQTRARDQDCDEHHGGYHHVFFPIGARYPAVGQPYRGYAGFTDTVPAGHAAQVAGARAVGGEVTRGGFGSTSHGWHGWSVGG